jgi:hypothetical protein
MGKKYNIFSLVFPSEKDIALKSGWFCSELAAALLHHLGLLRNVNKSYVPGDFT